MYNDIIDISIKHLQKYTVFLTSLILVMAPELYRQFGAMQLQMTTRTYISRHDYKGDL